MGGGGYEPRLCGRPSALCVAAIMGNSNTAAAAAAAKQEHRHTVLLGDSTLDNAAYTKGDLCIEDQMKAAERAHGNDCTSLALDGALISNIKSQLERLPPSATHLVISVGGNDSLTKLEIVRRCCQTIEQALILLHDVVQDFESEYAAMIALVMQRCPNMGIVVCTLYNPCFEPYDFQVNQKAANMGVALYNDALLRIAARHRIPVVDLRTLCTDTDDFANPIEPSTKGGQKITEGIMKALAHVQRAQSQQRLSHP